MKIVIACSRPGYIRGGQRHPASAAYPLGHFSHEQLLDIVSDPAFGVVVGEQVTPEMLGAERVDGGVRWSNFAHAPYSVFAEAQLDPDTILAEDMSAAHAALLEPPVVHVQNVDQGAPSDTTVMTTERPLIDPSIVQVHSGPAPLALDPAGEQIALEDAKDLAAVETVERMHSEEQHMAAAKGGAPGLVTRARGVARDARLRDRKAV